jgi:hypothetical protein
MSDHTFNDFNATNNNNAVNTGFDEFVDDINASTQAPSHQADDDPFNTADTNADPLSSVGNDDAAAVSDTFNQAASGQEAPLSPSNEANKQFDASDLGIDYENLNGTGVASSISGGVQHEESEYDRWYKKREVILRERAEREQEDKERLISEAKADIEKYKSEYDGRISKQKKSNRVEEKQFRDDMKSLMEHGTVWEKVARMTNLTPKTVEKGQQPRVERMRKLLIQLRSQKDKENSLTNKIQPKRK